jgi:DNA repair exonuclease SbcCD ATPase subunit
MSNNAIFYTQLASILGFIIVLFVLYRVLVSQKDATIQLLKEQITDLKEKLQEARSSNPDILAETLSKRIQIYVSEIERLKEDQDANKDLINDIEEKLKVAKKESLDLETMTKQIENLQNEIKGIRYEIDIDEEYIKNIYSYLDNKIMDHLHKTKIAYTTSELSDLLNVDPFLIDFRLNELITHGRVEKTKESPNTIKYKMIFRS